MEVTLSKLIAAAIALASAALTLVMYGFSPELGAYCLVWLFPLGLIWFAEAFGDYVGPVSKGYVSTPSPAWMIVAAGWIGLAALLFLVVTGRFADTAG